jgi:cytochrome c oxidase subunit III
MTPRSAVAEPFATEAQQHETATLGLWLFIATELMLFGALFLGLVVYRIAYPEAANAASEHLHLWLGGANTALLLTSSLTMALAVVGAREGRRGQTTLLLLSTALLGLLFLGVKAYEYRSEYQGGLMPGLGPAFPLGPHAELFFNFYFASTGLHALHLALGILALGVFAWRTLSRRLPVPARATRIEGLGMYWHFVDVVWVFLYPVLYLI